MEVEQPATTLYRRPEQRKGLKELMGITQGNNATTTTTTEDTLHEEEAATSQEPSSEEDKASQGVKLGWVKGVFIPVTLNILGVIMFLRLSW